MKNTFQVIITVLCCLLTVFATLAVKAWTMDDKYALKAEVKAADEKINELRIENREDHKTIQATLHEIAKSLGRLEGRTRNTP